MSTFIVEKLRKSVERVLEDALKGIETSNYELEFITKDKESRYLLGELNLQYVSSMSLRLWCLHIISVTLRN